MSHVLTSPSEGAMNVWVICFSPKDYPGLYTVRRHECFHKVGKPIASPEVKTAANLEAARALIPGGLVCLYRDLGDDPVIVETWV